MEIRRSLIAPIVDFYFCLMAPNRTGIADAMDLWKNKFAKGHHIAIETLVAALFRTRKLDLNSLRDKKTALIEIGRYLRNLERKLHGFANPSFSDPGRDSTRCARAEIELKAEMESLTLDLQKFLDAFNDTTTCLSKCRIRDFILSRYRREVDAYITAAAKLAPMPDTAKGFAGVAKKLSAIIEKGGKNCSCRMCGSIGDAIIALDAPRDMQLEHTDYSFDHLCPPIHQPHRWHQSDLALNRQIEESAAEGG